MTLAPMYFGFVTIQRIICLVQGRPPSAGIGIRPLAIHTELALPGSLGSGQGHSRRQIDMRTKGPPVQGHVFREPVADEKEC